MLVCNKISFGEKFYKDFIGYLHSDNKVKPLHIMLPKTSAYVKRYLAVNCLAVITLDSFFKKDDNYHLQVFFKKNLNTLREKQLGISMIIWVFFSSSDESDED